MQRQRLLPDAMTTMVRAAVLAAVLGQLLGPSVANRPAGAHPGHAYFEQPCCGRSHLRHHKGQISPSAPVAHDCWHVAKKVRSIVFLIDCRIVVWLLVDSQWARINIRTNDVRMMNQARLILVTVGQAREAEAETEERSDSGCHVLSWFFVFPSTVECCRSQQRTETDFTLSLAHVRFGMIIARRKFQTTTIVVIRVKINYARFVTVPQY